jgi:hypothetical protein
MGISEFATSVISVAPSALLDYAVIALVLKLPLRLALRWALRAFPLAMILMAAVHAWQQPVAVSDAICLATVLLARAAQATTAWAQALRAHPAPVGSPAA